MNVAAQLTATLNNVVEALELTAQMDQCVLMQSVEAEGFHAKLAKLKKDIDAQRDYGNAAEVERLYGRFSQLHRYFIHRAQERHVLMEQWKLLIAAFAASESQENCLLGRMSDIVRQMKKPLYNEALFEENNASFAKFMQTLQA